MIVHHLRSTALKCTLPRAPDGPCLTQQIKESNRHWTIAFDPDGTFAAENRLGRQDIYFGLVNWSFKPGTVIMHIAGRSDALLCRWTVEERVNYHGKLILDARAHEVIEPVWLRKELFHDL